jgi:lipopolysaccharide transport system ATP-binding protein
MSSGIVLQANNLGKNFKIYQKPWDRAREWLSLRGRTYHTDFWALKNISFELRRGEALGVLGQNGAGKSTLLKILNGAMFPTEGQFQIQGRVLSMLELGTGFNIELTGRQNIFNSAHLLGFPENYIAERIDDIEQFAEIGPFFDRPIKLYSSGMHARLAFSMFAFLECELLIIDEVLAVGDIFFTQKCYHRLDELRAQNTAMIMVTHNMSVIQQYCQQAIVLDKGQMVFSGTSSEAAIHYFYMSSTPKETSNKNGQASRAQAAQILQRNGSITKRSPSAGASNGQSDWEPGHIYWPDKSAFHDFSIESSVGEGWARCLAIAQCDDNGFPCTTFSAGQRAHWYYEYEALEDLYEASGVITILNEKNIRIHGKNTIQLGVKPKQPVLKGMRIRFHQSIALNILPGEYSFSIGLTGATDDDSFGTNGFLTNSIGQAGTFHVIPPSGPHLGLCDLPGECEVELCSSTYHPILDPAIPG